MKLKSYKETFRSLLFTGFESEIMKKLFFRKPPLDLHGITHLEVQVLVEDYVLLNQVYLPLQIITGNSQGMKNRVIKCLKEHGFSYQIGDDFNKGYIAVLK